MPAGRRLVNSAVVALVCLAVGGSPRWRDARQGQEKSHHAYDQHAGSDRLGGRPTGQRRRDGPELQRRCAGQVPPRRSVRLLLRTGREERLHAAAGIAGVCEAASPALKIAGFLKKQDSLALIVLDDKVADPNPCPS